jgi:hypothetical protein
MRPALLRGLRSGAFPLLSVCLACAPVVTPEQAYLAAVQDAAVAEPAEVATDLVAIVPENADLIWRGTGDNRAVLMVTWTSWNGYDAQVGQTTTVTRDVWVTAAPDVREFVRTNLVPPDVLTARLEQLLGVPPNNGKTKFVQFWVSPRDLFRPSADPEISDREAELDLPQSTAFITVSDAYQQWFANQTAISYGDNGYPWTRLGYTYDWGNPCSEEGLSEFVIRAGATVEVESVTSTLDYCRWW